ncbi:MAG: SurA domain [Caulobacteraceae bacterium]|nr:SurA domain [Caulobacteraceae bacterium]
MFTSPRRRAALLAAAAMLLPPLSAANAQLRAPRAAPRSRVTAPSVSLPSETPPAAAPAPAAAEPALPALPANALNEGVAAVVNDEIISTYDLRQRMRLLVLTSGVQPTQDNLQQLEQQALRGLVDEHLQVQELRKVGKRQKVDLLAEDKEVDDEIGDLAKQNNLTFAQMKASFAASGVDIQTLRDQIRTQISWQRLISGLYGSRVRVGDDQVTGQLQRISAQASQAQYQVGEIFLEANRAGGMNQALAGANQLIAQLQQGAPFPAVARQFSSAPTAANGGDAGWISAAQAAPEVAQALENLRVGQLSAPIQVNDGVYVVYLRDKQAASGQTMVSLKQLAVRLDKDATADQVAGATAALKALRPQITGCDNVEAVAGKAPGVVAADLGEAEINDLRGPFKEAAQQLNANQVSEPIRTDVGVHLVAVCSKRAGGAKVPSRADIQNRLYAEQLSVMSRRYLRDLRTSATIEAR